MQTYPELNATNPADRSTDRWMFTVPGRSNLGFAYLTAALVATTDLSQFVDALSGEIVLYRPSSDVDTQGDSYSFEALPSLDALAEAQGVLPTTDPRDLATDDWPADESVEDFIAAAMEGRYEEDESVP
ncbi:hypothetical protein BH18ACT11_BH18ACT11_15280 [soil metagenome]